MARPGPATDRPQAEQDAEHRDGCDQRDENDLKRMSDAVQSEVLEQVTAVQRDQRLQIGLFVDPKQ